MHYMNLKMFYWELFVSRYMVIFPRSI